MVLSKEAMADKTADAIKLNLRLPKALHKRLTRQARRNNVSLNTEIVNQLEGSAAAEIKKVIEATRPYHEEALKAATAGATAGTMALLANFFRGFIAAGEGQPLSEQDLRLRHRMINAWPDPDGVLQRAGREMRSAQDEAVRPAKESEQK